MPTRKTASKKKKGTPTLFLPSLDLHHGKYVQLQIEGLDDNFFFSLPVGADLDLRDITFDLQTPISKPKAKKKAAQDLIDPEYPPETEVDLLRYVSTQPLSKGIQPVWVSGYQIWNPDYPVRHSKGDKRKKQEFKPGFVGVVFNHQYDSRILWVPRSQVRKFCPLPEINQPPSISLTFDEAFSPSQPQPQLVSRTGHSRSSNRRRNHSSS